jgi:hypothetical protein
MNKMTILIAGAVTALALFAIGCGGGSSDTPTAPADDSGAVVSPGGPGGGLVARDKFLEFDGQRYMLTLELHEGMVQDAEFHPVGEATSADIPLPGGNVVYERDSDPDAVYTLSPATADGGELWLRWAKA